MIYFIDSSSLINLNKYYPRKIFVTLYNNLLQMIYKKNLRAPEQVYNEIAKKSDDLLKFINPIKKFFFISTTSEIFKKAGEIINDYPELNKNSNVSLTNNNHTDPYLIAHAIILKNETLISDNEIKIITDEGIQKTIYPMLQLNSGLSALIF